MTNHEVASKVGFVGVQIPSFFFFSNVFVYGVYVRTFLAFLFLSTFLCEVRCRSTGASKSSKDLKDEKHTIVYILRGASTLQALPFCFLFFYLFFFQLSKGTTFLLYALCKCFENCSKAPTCIIY